MKKMLKKSNVVAILLVIILLGITQNIKAASPGSPDSSFGVAGRLVEFDSGFERNFFIFTVQQDGSFYSLTTRNSAANLRKHTVKGEIDTAFAQNGTGTFNLGNNYSSRLVGVQSDGKIIIGGQLGSTNCVLKRIKPDGSEDTSFNGGGLINLTSCGTPRSIQIQPDGKILFIAKEKVYRRNPDGQPDVDFGSSGQVVYPTLGSSCTNGPIGLSLEVQLDGKILGSVTCGSDSELGWIFRLNSNGTPDTTFGTGGGAVATTPGDGTREITDIEIDKTTNKIYVVGNKASRITLARFNSNGSSDFSFNSGLGMVQIEPGSTARAESVKLQSDGKILVGGECPFCGPGLNNSLLIVRFNSDGSLDNSFAKNGILLKELSAFTEITAPIELSGDKLMVGTARALLRFNLSITPSQSGDFDGDGFGDIAVYRPSQGLWIILNSSNNTVRFNQFGLNGDIPIDGDFDGDGRNDLSIYRPSNGLWFVEKSSDGTNFARQFGTSSDKPVTDDYDKDGKADLAFFRPSSGEWFIVRSSDGFNSFFSFPFGQNGDIPIVKKGP